MVKLAPELNDAGLAELAADLESLNVDGLVLTNTLGGEFSGQAGGYSGAKLKDLSREALRIARSKTSKPIISVGGIDGHEEALRRWHLGASLLQIYSAWIFAGPSILKELAQSHGHEPYFQ